MWISLPGLWACSTRSTRRPRRSAVIAHISPAAPAPITTASNASAIASVRRPGRRHEHAGFDRQRSAFAIELEMDVLHHVLQAHRAIGNRAQSGDGRTDDVEQGEVADAGESGAALLTHTAGESHAALDSHHHARGHA